MNTRSNRYRKLLPVPAFILLLLCQACLEPELEPLNFFTVRTDGAEPGVNAPAGQVTFYGTLEFAVEGPVELDDYGFYWSEQRAVLEDENSQREVISIGAFPQGDLSFEAPGPVVENGHTYFFQAYARKGEREMLGQIQQYSYDLRLSLLLLERLNDSLRFSVSISNLSELALGVEDFGLIIEKDNPDPQASTADFVINFGAQIDNFSADTLVGTFDFNSVYYARPYYQGVAYTLGPVMEIRVTDGWTQGAFLPNSVYQSSSVVHQDKAYIFGGLSTPTPFPSTNILQYTPGAVEPWEIIGNTIPTASFEAGISAVWNDEVYYGYPRGNDAFWFPLDGNLPLFYCEPVAPIQVYNGIAFSIGEQLYFGTGLTYYPGAGGARTDTIWEVSPGLDCGSIRPVASLPTRGYGDTADRFGYGREGAIAFEYNGDYYVGGGSDGPLERQDLYRFVPPDPANPDDMGSWTFVGYLPGGARKEASAVTIGQRVFYGFGFNPGLGYFNDWWEFAPEAETGWVEREPCPCLARSQAISFGIGDLGYVAGGYLQFTTNGQSFNINTPQDTWIYTPPNEE